MEKRVCRYVIMVVTRGQCSSYFLHTFLQLYAIPSELLGLWWNLFCVKWLQVVCNSAFRFLTAIHCKWGKKIWRILVKAPEEILICSIHLVTSQRNVLGVLKNKLWLQNFFITHQFLLHLKHILKNSNLLLK